MKKKIVLLTILSIIISSVSFSQSDYEKTQNFKTKYKQMEEAIKNASTLDECNTISADIAKIKEEFLPDKPLLDKSLYPDNFETSFAKLEKALEIRKGDFTQIVELTSEVGTLKTQVTELSEKNQNLIGQIRQLNLRVEKDAATIASLQKLVAQLKSNIQQRDLLVRDIVDSLLAEFVNSPSSLNEAEKQSIISKVDSRNLFYNIERTISDNIQFMRVTQLTPEDLAEMKNQYRDFNKVWKQIGPRLADVYLDKREKAVEIGNIDGMFNDWNQRINEEMWSRIAKLFREKQIPMLPFSSGDQFTNSAVSFIDDEIKNLGVKSSDETERNFYTFTDSVYFPQIEPVWIPILIENNMMTEANKDTIDARIAVWKEKVAPASAFNWIYVGLIAVIVFLTIAYFLKGRKRSLPPQNE
ncbi:MAG TPA: hypothetical protein PLZ15_06170 [Melioribacteraceae bacterium]|nr:hypothetical protein [Melioribacteraceae bacterium]